MKQIAIIPARGGSKRLPRKNIKLFLGKPMIAYTIEAALQTGVFERVVVSTEDREIAAISEKYGAMILDRAEDLANDKASVVQVCLDVLEKEKSSGRLYEVMCCLYATAPMRTADDITKTIDLIDMKNCEFAMAVTDYFFSPLQALSVENDDVLRPMWPEWIKVKSQDAPKLHIDNGSTYAVSVSAFVKHQTFYGPNLRGHVMARNRSIDIDTQEDFELLQLIAQNL